jgi:1,4-alpha-glucan branching enzyme
MPRSILTDVRATASDDPYDPLLGDLDLFLFGEGTHRRLYEKLGAHLTSRNGVDGVTFAVWAPNARRVAVVGDHNGWNGSVNVMDACGGGVWECFVPGVVAGSRYKYEITDSHGTLLPLKADPFAFAAEHPPATASIVARPGMPTWTDDAWCARRADINRHDAPITIYEVHLGSWRRGDGNRFLTYDELADTLIPYAIALGFTHLELLPVTEHPFDGSWGYQPIGMFAPTSRFGSPEAFARFVDRAHAAGLGVLLDWVPGHFPTDAHGLGRFDGTALFEHADPREGFQPDWNTFVFNLGRHEVANYLLASALFWLDVYHIDGLRVDAVASMLYRDYSRANGAWIPNRFGGRENLEAIAFLQQLNTVAYAEHPGITMIAEESTAWPGVSRAVDQGGLGFGYKWNMGWMHDTLAYLHEDPIHRRDHQDAFVFSFVYAFSENYVLPLSHDEVVHGKGSLLATMPGDEWQRFANLRALFGYMTAYPGKKLLFMGGEFAQPGEWDHDHSLDWHVLDDRRHRGMQSLVRACNAIYRALPALHERDTEPRGLEWITSEANESIVAFARHGVEANALVVAITNATPVPRERFRIGVPRAGVYAEVLTTDAAVFGGSGIANEPVRSEPIELHGKSQSIVVTLPPLATILLRFEGALG